ncbi:MAG: glycoside hydrolase family 71/99-like protein [Limisphaerales bacterium]
MTLGLISRRGILLLTLLGWALASPAEEERYLRAYAPLAPFQGSSVAGVDTRTLDRKVVCGYQGWFRTPKDGSGLNWQHYSRDEEFRPGNCTIDLWPDLSEFSPDEKHPTPFKNRDGSTAHVFSSLNSKTVNRHFRWMKEYGIDGAFVQRFALNVRPGIGYDELAADNRKLMLCRDAANQAGRSYALMYDLTSLQDSDFDRVYRDWKLLRRRMKLTRDPAYLHHQDRPVVGIWGVGFSDPKRRYSLAVVEEFIRFVKDNPDYGGCSVVLGVPTGWREQKFDATDDNSLHRILQMADVISPWSVGRYAKMEEIERHAEDYWRLDQLWCRTNKLDYLPVVFPGFSWHNMHAGKRPLNEIPRQGGRFFWKQMLEAKGAGARMLYVAMFDELDEGTAIFKCTNDPPTGKSKFTTYEGKPSDHYLWLTGQAGRLIREEIPERN